MQKCEIRSFDDHNLYCHVKDKDCFDAWYRVGSAVQTAAVNDDGKICMASKKLDPAGNNQIFCNNYLWRENNESGWYPTPYFNNVNVMFYDKTAGFCMQTRDNLKYCTQAPEHGNWQLNSTVPVNDKYTIKVSL